MRDDATAAVPQETGTLIDHPIAVMRADHDDHIGLENNMLFPRLEAAR